MCLITFQWQPNSEQKLVISANRDEFLHRPALELHQWESADGVFAGKDLTHGGTWLGVQKTALKKPRFAFLTNHRDMSPAAREKTPSNPISRGNLVLNFLTSEVSALDYLKQLEETSQQYDGYNIVVAEGDNLGYFSNRSGESAKLLEPGLYGLSNALLDTPWPKLTQAKSSLNQWLHSQLHDSQPIYSQPVRNDEDQHPQLAGLLASTAVAADENLPATGIGIEMERVLSSQKIITPNYGTRCSTGVIWNRCFRGNEHEVVSEAEDEIEISEISWNADGSERSRCQHMIHSS